MDQSDLETLLDRPTCPKCNKGRIRPISIEGEYLWFNCPHCDWRARAELPPIKKTIIYLDTSILSHIARAKKDGKSDSNWLTLYEHLLGCVQDEILCCVDSRIINWEAELSDAYGHEIIEFSRSLGDLNPRNEKEIWLAQLRRALESYISGKPCQTEKRPPLSDAFGVNPHRWLGLLRISIKDTPSPSKLELRRAHKREIAKKTAQMHSNYDGKFTYKLIRDIEARGFGQSIITEGRIALERLQEISTGSLDPESITCLLEPTFFMVVQMVKDMKGENASSAVAGAIEFLQSDYVSKIPVADIMSRMHAALAIQSRGRMSRIAKESDNADISHMSTFLPYVDIFIADRFVASMCNQSDVSLGKSYGAEICSLGEAQVDEFIFRLDRLRIGSSNAELARRINLSIEEGGFIQEQTEKIKQRLRSRGIDPESK